jgi:hypothetical protein
MLGHRAEHLRRVMLVGGTCCNASPDSMATSVVTGVVGAQHGTMDRHVVVEPRVSGSGLARLAIVACPGSPAGDPSQDLYFSVRCRKSATRYWVICVASPFQDRS